VCQEWAIAAWQQTIEVVEVIGLIYVNLRSVSKATSKNARGLLKAVIPARPGPGGSGPLLGGNFARKKFSVLYLAAEGTVLRGESSSAQNDPGLRQKAHFRAETEKWPALGLLSDLDFVLAV
jgi:hypothetical protein